MTDEKVKEAADWFRLMSTSSNGHAVTIGEALPRLRALLTSHDALQAERDKLSGEVERLKRELSRANGFHEAASERADTAEEQSAARWRVQDDLFRQLQASETTRATLSDALGRARGWVVTASSSRVARQDLKAIDQALAHHSAPVAGLAGDYNNGRLASEAKLTALVEALGEIADEDDAEISAALKLAGCREIARQALAHHGAPVGEPEQTAEAWNGIAPGRRFGRRLTADAVETLERGTLLRFHSDDPWFDHSGDMPKYGEIVRFTGNVSREFPLVGAHLEVQSLDGRTYPGGGWVFRLFQFVAPPSTPTSAPVEDVGEKPQPVAWRVRDHADGWIYYDDEHRAKNLAGRTAALIQALYVAPPQEERSDPLDLAAADDNYKALVEAGTEALSFLRSIEGSGYGGMSAYDCACFSLEQALGAAQPPQQAASAAAITKKAPAHD